MRISALIVILTAAALLLAACNPAADNTDSTAASPQPGKPAPGTTTAAAPKAPVKGQPLPSFEFATLDGELHSIEDYAGKPLLINMWKINCPPCKAELPEFVKLYEEYKDKGLEIITLNVEDTADAHTQFMESKQPMPWVTGFNAGDLAGKWGVRGVPTSYFVNPDGVVVDIKLGGADRKYLDSLIPEWMSAEK